MTITYNSHPYGLLTYTSPSNKLVRKSDGLFKFSAHNLYLNSAAPANQSITVVSGATYAVTITGSVSVTASGAATGTWTAGTNTFTAATTTLTLGSTSGSGTVHVRRTPSDSLYLATTSTARYGLPFEWSAAGALQGIRVEPAATNLITYSNDLTNAYWSKSGASIGAATAGITGVSDMYSIVEDTSTGAHRVISSSIAVTAGSAYAVSCAVKPAGRSHVYVRFNGAGGDYIAGTVRLADAAVTQTAAGTITAELSDGIVFLRCTGTVSSGTTATVELRAANSDIYANYTGDGVSGIFVGNIQLEVGTTATSPIYTYGSTVSRAIDNISLPAASFPAAWPCSMLAVFRAERGIDDNVYNAASLLADTSNFSRIYKYNTNRGASNNSGGSTNADVASGSYTIGARTAVAVRFAANDIRCAVDGTLSTQDTSAALPVGSPTNLWVGNLNGGNALVGHLEKLVFVPRAWSDAELQSMSTL